MSVWDTGTGEELRHSEGHSQRVWCVVFSPDGCRILSGSADGSLRLWDVATGLQCHTFGLSS